MENTFSSITLVLTGVRVGTSCTLSKRCRFVKGRCTLRGDKEELAGLIKYMGRSYKAFPEGSVELAHQQKIDAGNEVLQEKLHPKPKEDNIGKRDLSKSANRVRVDGGEESAQPSGEATAGLDGAAGDKAGDVRSLPEGDGQSDTGNDQIREALAKLDPENDEHWTQEGKPKVDAVTALMEGDEVFISRADVDKAAPELRRPE